MSNTFDFIFTGGVAEGADPADLGGPLLGDGDVFGLARRIERAASDATGGSFLAQLPRWTGSGGQGLAPPLCYISHA